MTEQSVPDPQDDESPEAGVDTPPLELPADEGEDAADEEHQDQQTG